MLLLTQALFAPRKVKDFWIISYTNQVTKIDEQQNLLSQTNKAIILKQYIYSASRLKLRHDSCMQHVDNHSSNTFLESHDTKPSTLYLKPQKGEKKAPLPRSIIKGGVKCQQLKSQAYIHFGCDKLFSFLDLCSRLVTCPQRNMQILYIQALGAFCSYTMV